MRALESGGAELHPAEPSRVFIVDDHELVREGLRSLIASRPEFRVVGDAGTHHEALARIPATRPDLVVLDIRLPDADGLSTCREIRARMPHAQIIVFTGYSDAEIRRRAHAAGAAAHLLKTAGRSNILDVLHVVAAGGPVRAPYDVPGRPDRHVGDDETHDQTRRLVDALGPTERDVLHLVADGLTNRHIARELGISEKMVKRHLSTLFTTLGVSSRVSLAVVASRCGRPDVRDGNGP